MSKNQIKISGVITPADFFWLKEFCGDDAMTCPQDVSQALAAADTASDITLVIDSPGGYCDAGNAMIIALRDWSRKYGRKVNVEVGAQAASMAAVMMFSFDGTIHVHRNSVVMLHGARVGLMGDAFVAESLRDAADALDVINDIMVDTLVERTGRAEDEIRGWISGGKETFFGAKKLLALELIDGVIDAAPTVSAQAVSARAMNALSRLTAKADGGMLAAVAFAQMEKAMPETINEEEAIETPVAEAVEESTAEAEVAPETSEAPVATDEEKPEEEAPAEETEEAPAEEEEKPAEEEEKPEEEEAKTSLADTVAQAVAEAVSALKAENDALRAQLADLTVRAEKAEGIAQGLKAASVQAALVPPAQAAVPSGRAAVMAQWYAAVKAHGYDGARTKFPDLFAAAKTACAK